MAVLLVAILAAYAPALHGGFIWDDTVLLSEAPLVRAADGLWRFWFSTEAPDYWPLTNTTFWLEWRLWGTWTTGYHLTNLVLHAIEALLVWALLRRLRVPGAYLAALVFAVHPANVESVAWIAQRKNLVALLFFLPALLFYGKAEDVRQAAPGSRRWLRWYTASLGGFVLAMLGKGSAATLPLVLLVMVWWRQRRLGWADLGRVVPFFGVAAALVLVNIWFQTHGTGPIRQAGLAERLAGAGATVWFYLAKTILPVRLSFVYPQWEIDPSRLLWWIPSLAALLLTGLLFLKRDGWARPFFAAWLYFVAALLPVMGLTDVYFMKFSLVADHYLHVALIGVVALAGAGWSRLHERAGSFGRRLALAAAVVVVGALTVSSARQSALYRDAETLYRATIQRNPACWLCQYNLAVELLGQGRDDEAIGHLREAVRIKPDYAEAHNNLALELAERGQREAALAHARQAVDAAPELPQPRVNLGILLVGAGRHAEALPHLERAVTLRPGSAEAQYNLGVALAAVGRVDEALVRYQNALEIEPGSAQTLNALGTGLLATGRPAEARGAFESALRQQPDHPEALANLALLYAGSGQPEQAVVLYERALQARPENPQGRYNLATLLAGQGRRQEAIAHLEAALRQRPDYAEAHNNLAVLLAGEGRRAEAVFHLRQAVRLRPDFAPARLNLAEASARDGRFAEAVEQARVALELLPAAQRPAVQRRIEAWQGRI